MNGSIVFAGLYELRFTPEGFTLLDAVEGRWLIDANRIRDDGRFRIGRCTAKKIHDVEEPNPTYVIARLNAELSKPTVPNTRSRKAGKRSKKRTAIRRA